MNSDDAFDYAVTALIIVGWVACLAGVVGVAWTVIHFIGKVW
jgi:hypothetical protein